MAPQGDGLRLTELLASVSLATDLGTGQPLGHGLRTSLLAVEIARHMGLDPETIRSVQQVSLLRFLGCTADSYETARVTGGDEISFNSAMAPTLYGSSGQILGGVIRNTGRGQPLAKRAALTYAALREGGAGLAAHCEVAAILAKRLGLGIEVTDALRAAYERWDGKGMPSGLAGENIPVESRIAVVARDIDLFHLAEADVTEVLDSRRGKGYDPAVVDAFKAMTTEIPEANWDDVLAAEPKPTVLVEDLDSALTILGEFVDLKSPYTRGHSSRVADLAHDAALNFGLSDAKAEDLRRAGLVHDLGRVGVENGIWDKPGPLATDEWEKVRMHPYLTQRILSRCAALAPLSTLASTHHERMDGSGYHTGAIGERLPVETKLLMAADIMAALTARRPHRGPMDLDGAAELIRHEVARGRLDERAVECVIAAAGGEASPWANPDALTDREVEVLRLISGGLTNRQVGDELYISPKTVGRHVENIYAKIGVSTRAGAAVYAMERRLLA